MVHDKEFEILPIATIPYPAKKQKTKNEGTEEVFKRVKDLLKTGLTKENFNECLGELIPGKSVKNNTFKSRECLSLPKDKINHDDINKNDDTINHHNTISQDDTLYSQGRFQFLSSKMHNWAPNC